MHTTLNTSAKGGHSISDSFSASKFFDLPNLAFRCYKSVEQLHGMKDQLYSYERNNDPSETGSWISRDIKSSQLLVFILLEKAQKLIKETSHYLQHYNQQELQHFVMDLEQLEQKVKLSEKLLAIYR